MLSSPAESWLIELHRFNGGLGLLPCHPKTPREYRFQGNLIYSRMVEVEGTVLEPKAFVGRPIRIWLSPRLNEPAGERSDLGFLLDRTDELPDGGLEAMLDLPESVWSTATLCLSTIWKRLRMTGIDRDGRRVSIIDVAFSAASK